MRARSPRDFLADLRGASQSIHLVYYEWAADRFHRRSGGGAGRESCTWC